MDLKQVTDAALEPLSLEETKDHLRVDHNDDDSYIEPLIVSVRKWAEIFLNRALITQTWDLFLERFPHSSSAMIEIPWPELQSITTIKYQDISDIQQTWASSNYVVDINREIGRVVTVQDGEYPSTFGHIHDVEIRFIAGYGSNPADVPRAIIQAMLLRIGHFYERREDSSVVPMSKIPHASDDLLWSYKVTRFA